MDVATHDQCHDVEMVMYLTESLRSYKARLAELQVLENTRRCGQRVEEHIENRRGAMEQTIRKLEKTLNKYKNISKERHSPARYQ